MANILYLVHRLPYPPNKGDKVRSYHLLKHLVRAHRVFLGTFIDDPEDERHLDTVRPLCAGLHVVRLNPGLARLYSLRGLFSGEALSLPYYRDASLQAWVDGVLAGEKIDAIVLFSSPMAQYVGRESRLPVLLDFVDVDSAKWTQYAQTHRGPKAWIYGREGRLLLAFERRAAMDAVRSFFVTENEADLFRRAAPECAGRVEAMQNGVDADFFRPDPALPTPFCNGELPIVFTGAMDYHPNEDAAVWFAREVMPLLADGHPEARFYVVGRAPTAAVRALAGEHVVVSGTVPDVRPYLQHAALVVAPLRIARGIQNKILEAMAMARPVVASAECAGGVDALPGIDFLVAAGAKEFAARIGQLFAQPDLQRRIGEAARRCVLDRYSWQAHLAVIDRHLARLAPAADRREAG
jgi:sugar transferase (PEP-CTERM/EpsH1 system associated)